MLKLLRLTPLLLLLTAPAAWAQGFTIAASPDTQSISAGQQATFSIDALPEGGFNSSVFLTVSAPTLNSTTIEIDPPKLNAPYTPGATLTVAATGNDLGSHQVVIEGRNGEYARYDTVTVTVTAAPEPSQWTVYHTGNSGLPSMLIRAIEFDRTGGAWIGTETGLAYAPPGQAPVLVDGPMATRRIKGIAVDSNNAVWFASDGMPDQNFKREKFTRYLNGEWTDYPVGNLQDQLSETWAMAAAPDGSIWIATFGRGMLRFKENEWTQFTMNNWGGVVGDRILDIAISPQGELWAPASGFPSGTSGLISFDGSFWTTYSPQELGLGENMATTRVAIGDAGRVWLLHPNGLISILDNNIAHHTLGFGANTLGVGLDGRVWLSSHTPDGNILYGRKGTSWEPYPLDSSGLSSDARVNMITVSDDGSVWIGTGQHGLAILRPRKATVGVSSIERPASSLRVALVPNPITAEGTVALSTPGGAARISLHDNLGRQVAVLFDGMLMPGENSLPVDLSALPAGAYMLSIAIDGSLATSRMVIVTR